MSDLVGRTLDHYRIEAKLGEGTIGRVYRAQDEHHQRKVALKIINANYAQNEGFRQQFMLDMRLLSSLSHRNLVRIYEPGVADGLLYLASEYIDGDNLHTYLANYEQTQPFLSLMEVAMLIKQIAEGLHYLHDQGMAHLALKPANIHLRTQPTDISERAVLSDIGIRSLFLSVRSSEILTFEQSLAYVSPEICTGQPGDALSDMYALGMLIYRLAVGKLPFNPQNFQEAVEMHTRRPVPLPLTERPGLPIELQRIILQALQKDPNNRYQTAAKLARDLADLLDVLEHWQSTMVNPGQSYQQMTQAIYETTPGVALNYTQPEVPPDQLNNDRIVIYMPEPPTRATLIEKDLLTIGRDKSADITVDSKTLSRFHARVERSAQGEYTVTDLGSTNNTWVGSKQLKRDESTIWNSGVFMRMGEVRFMLETAESLQPTSPGQSHQTTILGKPTDEVVQDTVEQVPLEIETSLDPPRLTVRPGEIITSALTIRNEVRVDHFTIMVRSDSDHWLDEWVMSPDAPVEMLKDDVKTVQLTFKPAMKSTSIAGTYPFEVIIISRGRPNTYPMVLPGQLEIEPFYQVNSDLHPTRLRGDKSTTLTLHNLGNTRQEYTLNVRDPEDALDAIFTAPTVTLPPGDEKEIKLQLRPRQRAWFGATERYTFEVAVSDNRPDIAPQTHAGELTVKPRITRQMITLTFLFMALCGVLTTCAVAALVSSVNNRQARQETREAVRQLGITETFTFEQTLESRSDMDGDGLTNMQEIELETDPSKEDTDGDGLDDYEEAFIYGTNPTARDTDGDTLSDGAEINGSNVCFSSPTNTDTDGDGNPDNTDPNPCALPTPTPFPTAVPVPVGPPPGS